MLMLTRLFYERYKYTNIQNTILHKVKRSNVLGNLNKNGFAVIENFWSESECKSARANIDNYIENNEAAIQWDSTRTDARIIGSERRFDEIKKFHNDLWINDIAHDFYREKTTNLFTLAARMKFNGENLGSGNGWHRDSFSRQFKAMLYLSDVSSKNGPFQYVRGTNNYSDMKQMLLFSGSHEATKRYTESEVEKYLQTNGKLADLKTFQARAGDLILFDSSGLHRGQPILDGTRYALTLYAMRSRSINSRKLKKFGLSKID